MDLSVEWIKKNVTKIHFVSHTLKPLISGGCNRAGGLHNSENDLIWGGCNKMGGLVKWLPNILKIWKYVKRIWYKVWIEC